MMTPSDHPIPDDLVAIARRIHMTQFDDADLCDCADDELLDADTLATLAEWADDALIDPNAWTRYDRAGSGEGQVPAGVPGRQGDGS